MSRPQTLDLPKEDFEIVAEILRTRLSGRPIYIFGSRVTGRARRRSDLDIAVGGRALTLSERADLREAFSQSDLPIMVDVVDLAHATGAFRQRIEGEWIPFDSLVEQLAIKVAA